jgi:hypothetical protein
MKAGRYLLTLGVSVFVAHVLSGASSSGIGPVLFPAHAEETPAEMLAAHIRRQGYRCDAPVSAERDAARSKPDEAVWVLRCSSVSYRLTLVPDMEWKVQQLE